MGIPWKPHWWRYYAILEVFKTLTFGDSWRDRRKRNDFLPVIPTLTHYSDIVSNMPYRSIYWIYIYSDCLSDILSGIYSDVLSNILAGIYSDILSEMGTAHWDLELAVEARQCPLSSGAVPTEIWRSRLRSGACGWLRSGALGWGPAVPTEMWSSRLRSGSAHWDLEFAVGRRRKEEGGGSNSDKI